MLWIFIISFIVIIRRLLEVNLLMNEEYNIGINIRNRRKQLGMSQEKLAELSKLSVNYISRIELEKDTNLSINVLSAISTALKINMSDLLIPDGQTKKEFPYYMKELIDNLLEFNTDEANEISEILLQLIAKIKS